MVRGLPVRPPLGPQERVVLVTTENKAYIEAMREARRSNACAPRTNRHRAAKRGLVKGGRPRRHQMEG